MSLRETIKSRVSTAKFASHWVNPHHLVELLDVAIYAPNHKMRQPWRFIILEGEGKDRWINHYLPTIKESDREEHKNVLMKVMSAPAVVVFVMKKNPVLVDDLEDLQACAALIQNFLLLLEEEKIGSFWKTPKYIDSDKFKDSLNIKGDEIIVALVMVGYPAVKMEPKPRKSAHELTTIF
ncbi:MAG TPA: nitroreductase [Acholeplasmataceae bacterium]|nr:nitroreductase [Acholeplasmataceae bacterium]